MDADEKTLPASEIPEAPDLDDNSKQVIDILTNLLSPVKASADLAVQVGRSISSRLSAIEQRLSIIERHVGLNGGFQDTEPAPSTEPEPCGDIGG